MSKFTIHDTGVFRTDPFLLLNRAGIPVAQSYSEIGKFDSDGLLEIVDYITALESRLREAEAVIKLQNDVINRWSINETAFGEQELEARFGKIEYPDSSIWVEEWLDRVLRSPTLEANARAAAFLKGGDTNKV